MLCFIIHLLLDCQGNTRLSIYEGDIRDGDYVRKACRGASVVFHIASIIDITDAMEYNEMYGINVKGEVGKVVQQIHFLYYV